MTIASRITDAIDAIAAAFNARNAPGPSDFQMWVAADPTNRATATIADYRQAMIGPDEDYAGYLNGLLVTPPRAGAASEAQAGVTQLATAAEVAALTSSTKAVSPLRLAGAIADIIAGGRLAPTNKDVSGGDWNTQNVTGFFMGQNMLNSPEGASGWNWVTVQRYANDWATQHATTFTPVGSGATGGVPGATYFRTMISTTWGAWTRVGTFAPPALTAVNNAAFTIGNGFNNVPWSQPTGRTEWTTNGPCYVTPRAGTYLVKAFVRLPDGAALNQGIGLGVKVNGNETYDRNYMTWQTTMPASGASVTRTSIMAQRLFTVAAGVGLTAETYSDGPTNPGIVAQQALLEVLPVGN